jgi:hypothetical protein
MISQSCRIQRKPAHTLAAREALARVSAKPDLSNDVREVVSRALTEP